MEVKISKVETKTIQLNKLDRATTRTLIDSGYHIDEVDDVEVLGICEYCERPILAGEPFKEDWEGICWHTKCETSRLD